MSQSIRNRILELVRAPGYQPISPEQIAKDFGIRRERALNEFDDALADLEDEGIVAPTPDGKVAVAKGELRPGEVLAIYSGNRKGFGFLDVKEPAAHPQLFVPGEHNAAKAVSGDVVRAKVLPRPGKEPGDLDLGRIVAIVKRAHGRLVGTLQKKGSHWFVLPDGNIFPDPIDTPDAAGKYIKTGSKVVVDITRYPTEYESGQGVVSEVLGEDGQKDIDLRSILIQHNLPEDFPEEVKEQAREAVRKFDVDRERSRRLDLTDTMICTIDPDDAKDYDDAISLEKDDDGNWTLGVHIADVSFFVEKDTPLDTEASHRGNSVYFPGYVVPMLPEVLSNGVCSLQEGVHRLVKSAFITIDARSGKPLRTTFSNSIIKSAKRLRYREAQALIDHAETIPHPDGDKKRSDYDQGVLKLLDDMHHVAKLMQKRRHAAGQLVLDLPKVDLILDETGKVIDAKPEDDSFTHTLIEMFMVEANEAVARLFHRLDVPAIRRTHPDPDPAAGARLNRFVLVAGHKISTEPTRHDLQKLLAEVKDKPERFAVNLAVLKSLARAEYSPEMIGHYALASEHYTHFTSPIRRYADLMVHRLLDAFFEKIKPNWKHGPVAFKDVKLKEIPTYEELIMQGQHLSFTERKADDAERELRQIKLLELMEKHVGEHFLGVVTAITKFGLFIQLDKWLIEGLVRYPNLLGDYWELDEKGGVVRGRKTGRRIHIGDVAKVQIVRADIARRELDINVVEFLSRGANGAPIEKGKTDKGKTETGRPNKKRSTAFNDKRNGRVGGKKKNFDDRSREKGKGRRGRGRE
jgi:ribonuclease R